MSNIPLYTEQVLASIFCLFVCLFVFVLFLFFSEIQTCQIVTYCIRLDLCTNCVHVFYMFTQ